MTRCDWFCPDVFGLNLMWPVVFWFCPIMFGPKLMWSIMLMWLNCYENFKRFIKKKKKKKFKVPKKNPKLQERRHLKKNFKVQKRNSKFKRENDT